MQAARVGMGVDNFFQTNGHRLRNVAMTIAPYLAAEAPALAAGVATAGPGRKCVLLAAGSAR